jgi:hypothetical protein
VAQNLAKINGPIPLPMLLQQDFDVAEPPIPARRRPRLW